MDVNGIILSRQNELKVMFSRFHKIKTFLQLELRILGSSKMKIEIIN